MLFRQRRDKKLARLLALLVTLFGVCSLPRVVVNVVEFGLRVTYGKNFPWPLWWDSFNDLGQNWKQNNLLLVASVYLGFDQFYQKRGVRCLLCRMNYHIQPWPYWGLLLPTSSQVPVSTPLKATTPRSVSELRIGAWPSDRSLDSYLIELVEIRTFIIVIL